MLRTADGYTIIASPGSDRPLHEQDTLQCVHCGAHFPRRPPRLLAKTLSPLEAHFLEQQGRIVRGFCLNCDGPICGPGCAACIPEEQMLENIEAGRPTDHKPIRVNVPRLWGGD